MRAWQWWGGTVAPQLKIAFWRTRRGTEVDFIVQAPGELVAIEVKNAGRVRDTDLASLRAFGEDFPLARLALVYRGQERLKHGDVLSVPVESFLKRLDPAKSLSAALGIRA